MVIRGLNAILVILKTRNIFPLLHEQNYSIFHNYQTFSSLFELEPVAGKKVTVEFSAPELTSLGGLSLVREYEKSSNRIIERILSEKPCSAGEMRTNRTATAKIMRGGYE